MFDTGPKLIHCHDHKVPVIIITNMIINYHHVDSCLSQAHKTSAIYKTQAECSNLPIDLPTTTFPETNIAPENGWLEY